MSAAHAFAIFGAVAQIAGFSLVLRELRRLNREELGHVSRWQRLVEVVRETIQNPAPIEIQVHPAESVSSAEAVLVTIQHDEAPLEALRRRLGVLEQRLAALDRQVSSQAQEMRARADAMAAQIERRVTVLQDQRRRDIGRAIKNERLGTLVFILGVLLNLVASLSG